MKFKEIRVSFVYLNIFKWILYFQIDQGYSDGKCFVQGETTMPMDTSVYRGPRMSCNKERGGCLISIRQGKDIQ